MKIPFNRPHITGKEIEYLSEAIALGHLSGDGSYTKRCQRWLEKTTGCNKALLTHSCTAALEMAAILADIQPGDQIIMPSYTFASTANAFVLRGGVPVFVDIRKDTLNIDERIIRAAINEKTKAIVPVHYAGVPCEMNTIMSIAEEYKLIVIEDSAQGIMSLYRGRPLGSIGHMAAVSFHESKNIISGEGGALIINDPNLVERAEIIREKGTNRKAFLKGMVDKYTWVDMGSSYLPGELVSALLMAQLESAHSITEKRMKIWKHYYELLSELESQDKARRPQIPSDCIHNAHIFYLLLNDWKDRDVLLDYLDREGIGAVSHYVPLHISKAGRQWSIISGILENTEVVSKSIVRLPVYPDLTLEEVKFICGKAISFFN